MIRQLPGVGRAKPEESMRTHWLVPALCAASVLLASGCGGSSGGPTDGGGNPPPSGDVLVQNNLFNPSSFTVATGSAVTWAWDSNGESHSVTFNDQPIDSDIQTSGTFQHTFSTAGTFAYHCKVHSNMTGTITVSASGSAGNPPASGGGGGSGSGGGMGGGYGY